MPSVEQGEAAGVTYLTSGKRGAPAVLLLHGIGSDATAFAHQLPALADSAHVIAWNAPGYAGSAPFDDPRPRAGAYADAALRLLDELSIDRCHLVGSSLGAIFAAQIAVAAPERVRGLVMTAPVVGSGRSTHTRDEEYARRRAMIADGVDAYLVRRASALAATDAPSVTEAVRVMTLRLDLAAYSQAAYALADADLIATAGRVNAPSLVLCGEYDGIAPPISCRAVAAALSTRCIEFDGCAHLLELEDPRRFTAEIAGFMAASTKPKEQR